MPIRFPCRSCKKPVKCNQKALLCTVCNKWIHISCTGITEGQYVNKKERFENWSCNMCIFEALPFSDVDINSPEVSVPNFPKNVEASVNENSSMLPEIPSSIMNDKSMSIVHLNIRSLRNKLNDVGNYVKNNAVDIFALSETWIDNTINSSSIDMPGYILERRDRNSHGGGVACYLKQNVPYLRRKDLENNDIEIMWLEIKSKNQIPLFVGVIYRKPDSPFSTFYNSLESNLEQVFSFSDNVILLGDLNCNMLTKNPLSNKVNELCSMYHLDQTIKEPTRITPHSSTLIDVICVSNSVGEITKKAGTNSVGFSDHSLVYVTLSYNLPKSKPEIFSFRSFRHFSEEEFVKDLSSVRWDSIIAENNDVETNLAHFTETFSVISLKHAPFVSVRKKLNGAPWITSTYLSIARDRDYHKRKFIELKSKSTDKGQVCQADASDLNVVWNKYKHLRNQANNLNKKLKKEYFYSKLQRCGNNTQKSWKVLRDLLSKKKNTVPSNIKIGTDMITDKLEIAKAFNQMFVNVGNCVPRSSNKIFNSLNTLKQTKTTFKFKEIEVDFVQKELQKIDISKAAGLDDMHPRLLKSAGPCIAEPLTRILNQSLRSGFFPSVFKKAKIVPVPKGGDLNDLGNFRPISLLSCISKILERAVHTQLYDYLQEYKLLSSRQSGFRPKHSTATCLIEITDFLLNNLDSGLITGAIFLDLKKAFDIISHEILLSKMPFYGIKTTELQWFSSYLCNRQQCVSFQGIQSDFENVTSGVPQGSILGPLLFCIFINDMCNLKFENQTKIALYADDTALFCKGKNIHDCQVTLQKEYDLMREWFRINEMQINYKKTKVMVFGTKRKVKNHVLKIAHEEEYLENVTSIKYLGVTLEQSLNWSLHVSNTISKINRAIACIRRIKSFLTEKILAQLYFSFILPHIDYCSVVWGKCNKTDLLKLQRTQNRYARLVLNADNSIPKETLLNNLGWQSVASRISHQYCISVFKILNDLAPYYLNDLATKRPIYYVTRHSTLNPLFIPKPNSEFKKRSFSFIAPSIYNKLPPSIRTTTTLTSFKTQLRLINLSSEI